MQIRKKKVQKKSHLLSQQHGIQQNLTPIPLPTFSFWGFLHREQPRASVLSYEGWGESPTENPAATESAENLKNLGEKM
jgi:hypothetical protein